MFFPKSIAIVGASDDPTKVGGRPLKYLVDAGFEGSLVPVNSRRRVVQGVEAVASVLDLPQNLDLGLICLPAPEVLQAVRDCGSRGVKTAIVFSAGFSEIGDGGRDLEEEVAAAADEGGVLLCGPNSVGVLNSAARLAATFVSGPATRPLGRPSDIALIVQSGAAASYMYEWCAERLLPIGQFVSVGNEACLDICDYLDYFATLDGVRAIGLFVEGVRDGRRLRAAAERARASGRLVCIVKTGRSAAGARAALSHTGALVGTDAVHDGVYRQSGILRVADPHQMLDVMQYVHEVKRPDAQAQGVAVLTASGGMGVWVVDELEDADIPVATLEEETIRRLRSVLPPYGSANNPVDVTGQTINEPGLIEAGARVVLEDANVDCLVIVLAYQTNGAEDVAHALCELASSTDKVVITAWMFAPDGIREVFRAAGVPFFGDIISCIRGMGRVVEWSKLDIDTGRD